MRILIIAVSWCFGDQEVVAPLNEKSVDSARGCLSQNEGVDMEMAG